MLADDATLSKEDLIQIQQNVVDSLGSERPVVQVEKVDARGVWTLQIDLAVPGVSKLGMVSSGVPRGHPKRPPSAGGSQANEEWRLIEDRLQQNGKKRLHIALRTLGWIVVGGAPEGVLTMQIMSPTSIATSIIVRGARNLAEAKAEEEAKKRATAEAFDELWTSVAARNAQNQQANHEQTQKVYKKREKAWKEKEQRERDEKHAKRSRKKPEGEASAAADGAFSDEDWLGGYDQELQQTLEESTQTAADEARRRREGGEREVATPTNPRTTLNGKERAKTHTQKQQEDADTEHQAQLQAAHERWERQQRAN